MATNPNGCDNQKSETAVRNPTSLKLTCCEGDLLIINTRTWWHHTEIPDTGQCRDQLSVSYARDFRLERLSAWGEADDEVYTNINLK